MRRFIGRNRDWLLVIALAISGMAVFYLLLRSEQSPATFHQEAGMNPGVIWFGLGFACLVAIVVAINGIKRREAKERRMARRQHVRSDSWLQDVPHPSSGRLSVPQKRAAFERIARTSIPSLPQRIARTSR